eukprot:COSAG05_NODE_312_length_11626_cov_9.515485_10_plen_65_part_00
MELDTLCIEGSEAPPTDKLDITSVASAGIVARVAAKPKVVVAKKGAASSSSSSGKKTVVVAVKK